MLDSFKTGFQKYVEFLSYEPTRWQFVLSCLVISYLMYVLNRRSVALPGVDFVKFLFPKNIYFHRSTKNDVIYALALPIVSAIIFLPLISFLLSLTHQIHIGVDYLLTALFGARDLGMQVSAGKQTFLLIFVTLIFAMALDFGFYLHHLAFHKIPFLWEFHKIHHSAEVLTPLTDFRAHPVEILTYGLASGTALGLVQGVFTYFSSSQPEVVTIWGLNAVFFTYYLAGYALRHSHIWISYGPILSKVFISPAQHQIHHSVAKKHWDRNFGGTFALWDWLFGTLYVPAEKEDLKFGIGSETEQYQSVPQMYLLPFRKNIERSKISARLTLLILAAFLLSAIWLLVTYMMPS